MAQGRQEKRVRAALALAVLVSVIVWAGAFALLALGRDWMPRWMVVLACALLAAGYCWACLPWWRQIDHMERDSWLTAWFWGGGYGAVVALLATAAIGGLHSDWFRGGLLVMGAATLGHIVFQAVWRYVHRGGAA